MKFSLKKGSKKDEMIRIRTIWQKSEKKILKVIYNLTGLAIKTRSLVCHIDNSTTNGLYGKDNITLGVKGGIIADDAKMVIAHELVHVFYWKKLRTMHLTKSSFGNEPKWEWNLAEVTAFLITNEPSLKRCWPRSYVGLYPELKSTYNKVKSFWKSGDFDYFLIQSYNTLR